MVREGGKTRH